MKDYKKTNTRIIIAILVFAVLVLAFTVEQKNSEINQLKASLKLTQAKYENAESERRAYEKWLTEDSETIEELKSLLDENGISYTVKGESYSEAMENIPFYSPQE